MEVDKTTLNDLAIFDAEEQFSVFNKINCTQTRRGEEQLRKNLITPLVGEDAIKGVQQTLQQIIKQYQQWPKQISNGTIMVVERFIDAVVEPIPATASAFSAYSYKVLHGPDFSLVKYSATHCFDVIKGMQQMVNEFLQEETALPLKQVLLDTKKIVFTEQLDIIKNFKKATELSMAQMLQFASFVRYRFKHKMLDLLQLYAQLDAWYGMAMAVKKYNLVFPEFIKSDQPFIDASGLYHILLEKPVAYETELNRQTNFLFLTGANMAGKSTFIKAVGSAVFLAHNGMGVPAKKMQLSVFDGLLSNINVIDDISKGESYFFNEVQRIKATISKINDGRKWFILIDELFKGTNVEDAMKCSSSVIEGLLKVKNSLFILSTHLYEIGDALKKYPNITFNYFETTVSNDQLYFSYKLHEGISNDRLGYFILKKEGVVKMLEDL
jgi:DNA mismatch repair ATPase MutS